MNWLQDIKIEELPPQYQDIARLIGLENTVKLAERFNKLGFYFAAIKPGKPLSQEYQEMCDLIGLENTIKLAGYFRGGLVYFLGLEEIVKQKKYEYIMKNKTGGNYKELARATGYSERWVYEIIWNEQQKKRMARQLRLF